MPEPEGPPIAASYIRFLDHHDASETPRSNSPRPARGDTRPPGFVLPRRRQTSESLRVRLTPEQLYWLRLAAARAGGKIDESAIIAAGIALLERLPIDWRRIASRTDLAQALTRALEREP